MRNYTVYHLHSDYSNCITNIDSVTKPIDYIKRAKELGMKAIAFSEHGCVLNWVEKKTLAEEHGLKYIHGAEIYLTNNKEGEKKTRDNYHCGVYAKNHAGVLEINELLTKANNKNDHHYYYTPRVTFEELYNTSDNVIITTACIGGVLHNSDNELKNEFIQFLTKNKHRCFLEIQHHQDKAQINYNKYLLDLSKWSGIRLIAGTDTHALNETHAKGRKILQRSKSINFEDEDGWDITFKTYDELFELYTRQNIFSPNEISEALENTNILADMVEEFELDKSFKYPKLVDNSLDVLRQQIMNGINEKKINLYNNYNEYIDRIKYELDTYKHQNMEDFLLLDADIKAFGRSMDIYSGPGRGSVTGSLIAYLIGITEVDPIKDNLNFERFANKERISLGDIDSDWPPSKREEIKNYVFNKPNLYCAEIITFNTVALKGSVRDVCRAIFTKEPPKELSEKYEIERNAYGVPTDETSKKMRAYTQGYLEVSNYICKNIDDGREDLMRQEYPEVFEYVDIINGTIVSCGSHPCGSIVSPIRLDTNIGTISLSTTDRPVSTLSKNFVEMLNFVKLDILGLDNIEIINETCKLAGIKRLTPENVPDDENVWKSIRENTIGIFQWESDTASKYLEALFSDETIAKIKEIIPDFKYIDLFSAGNGAIRPAGASYRAELASGIVRDNGHYALNNFLSPTLGYLVYQEQIIEFLNKFCKFSMGEADMVRRAFAKKTGTEKYIPKIKQGFIKTMKEKYGVDENKSIELIENFLQVIIDASDYLFSLNHSQAYSYIGYICGYLRYYYPLEFFTVLLNQIGNDKAKAARIMSYIKTLGIEVEQPAYGKSRASYFCDKENNTIYKGLESIKYLNEEVAENLYELSKVSSFDNAVDLFMNIESVNSRQLDVLIKIGYFREFGSIKKLLKLIDLLNKFSKKTYKKDNLNENQINILRQFAGKETVKQFSMIDKEGLLKFLFDMIPNDELPINILASYQAEFIGDITVTDDTIEDRYYIVTDVDTKYTPSVKLYRLKDGEKMEAKVYKKFFTDKPLSKFDTIYMATCEKKNRKRKVDNKWISTDEFNLIITYYKNV